MALGKKAAPAAQFEDDSTPAPAAAAEAAPPKADPAAAAAQATTAIATAKAGAVAVGGAFGDVFKQFENALPDLEFGTVARLVGSNGRIQAKINGKKLDLGGTIKVSLVSFGIEYQISPGSDSDEATKLVRYSKDGKKIDGTGESVDDYLTMLRETKGFEKAAVKKYTQLVCILDEVADKSKDQSLVNEMVQISLSPTAGKAFDGMRLQRSVKVSRGLATAEGSDKLVVRADVRTNGSNEYTALAVSDK